MATQPNIVVISDDQHRWDFVEMTGRFPVRTPNMARLAREGVWHRHAYSNCPLCMPARCSLHTGLYAHQTGVNVNIGHWPLDLPTLPRALQGLGYHTAAIGKLHVFEAVPEHLDLTTVREQVMSLGYDELHEVSGKALAWHADCEWTHMMQRKGLLDAYRADGSRRAGKNDCFPFQFDASLYMDAYIGDRTVEWLRACDGERPFFLWAGLVSPHPPFDAPVEFFRHYPPEEQPLPVDNPQPGVWPVKRALYAGMVEVVDHQIGRILAVLEERGVLDNTLVLFVADHGEMLGDHGLSGKCHPHDPSTRVPLLARYPALILPGTVSDALAEITDIPATCLHAASGQADVESFLPRSPARSLVPHWAAQTGRATVARPYAEPAPPVREFIYSEDGGQFCPPYQMIRTDEWKYVFFTRDQSEALFNVQDDPDECRNLAADPACREIVERLKNRLLQHIADTPAPLTRRAGEYRHT